MIYWWINLMELDKAIDFLLFGMTCSTCNWLEFRKKIHRNNFQARRFKNCSPYFIILTRGQMNFTLPRDNFARQQILIIMICTSKPETQKWDFSFVSRRWENSLSRSPDTRAVWYSTGCSWHGRAWTVASYVRTQPWWRFPVYPVERDGFQEPVTYQTTVV